MVVFWVVAPCSLVVVYCDEPEILDFHGSESLDCTLLSFDAMGLVGCYQARFPLHTPLYTP
jgi:hypothetical protein